MQENTKNNLSVHDWIQKAKQVLEIEIDGLREVEKNINETFVLALQCLAECSGRVVVVGLGKSGLVGRKIAATLSSTGTPAFFLHPVEGAHGDMGALRKEDVVLMLSNSGETDELNAILPSLKELTGTLIGLTADKNSTMARFCDIVLLTKVPKEACPLGLAPTASTTATLALGDALAVCLIHWKSFEKNDFHRFHPSGALGRRLALPVADFMHTEKIPLLPQTVSLDEALQVLDKGGLGTVLFYDEDKKLSGILTDGDIRRLVCSGRIVSGVLASEVMTVSPAYSLAQESSACVLDRMEKYLITVLPVVDEGLHVVGLVHLHDMLGKGDLKFSGMHK